MEKVKSRLTGIMRKKQLVQISREDLDPNNIYGIPLEVSNSLCLIQYLYDFDFDGYQVIRLCDITRIRSDKHERFFESVLEQEGIWDVGHIPVPDLTNWKVVLSSLKELGKNVIVECEQEGDFDIGRIIGINEESVEIVNFDTLGRWDKKSNLIPLAQITSINFDTRYINIFSKYAT